MPLLVEEDYETDEKNKTCTLTEEGNIHVEQLLGEAGLLTPGGGMYDAQNITVVHHINQALRAQKMFLRDVDYIVKDDKVIIIDEFTGRMMDGRRFSDGLHQALEAKEHVTIQRENQTLASITFQNYFRLYPKLAGMTGTAMTEAAEFSEIYNLDTVEVPTNVDAQRIDVEDEIYGTMAEKYQAIADKILDCQKRGQPVLVGTVSIEKSEELSNLFKKNKIKHNVLNARHHEQEAKIIALAGCSGAVTIATNMAGRGTDIQMGGNFDMRVEQEIPDNVSEERRAEMIAQLKADIEKDGIIAREAGGLFVIGTERHESRRIDNQLRGRSGRQGDPGASMFYLSLEDDLMRIFGSERMEGILNKLGLRDGEKIAHPWISTALEKAQQKVEARNFDVRKNLLKFDNIMNDQRKVIYEQRRDIMKADSVTEDIADMRNDVISGLVSAAIPPHSYAEQWDIEGLKSRTQELLALNLPLEDWAKEEGIAEKEIEDRIIKAAHNKMSEKEDLVGKERLQQAEKAALLGLLDSAWKDHLLGLDQLRQGIHLRGYGQRDPLNEYSRESFGLFHMMLDEVRENVTKTLMHAEVRMPSLDEYIASHAADEIRELHGMAPEEMTPEQAAAMAAQAAEAKRQVRIPMHHSMNPNDPETWINTPRNKPCPCGSGKKYKHCHGAIN